MRNTRLKDVVGGILVGILVCLILVACGSDNSKASNSDINQGGQSQGQVTNGNLTGSQNGAGQPQSGGAIPANPVEQVSQINPTGNLNQDIRNVIKATRPAVVLIAADIVTNGGNASGDFGGLFGGGQQVEHGIGTGSIITPDGYILTNNHVIEGATNLKVVVNNSKTYKGRVVGRESRSNDIAIVKIDPQSGETFPTIKIGDSSKLEVGEEVVAIGNALGLEGGPTATAGIVSAIGRSIQEPNGAQLSQLVQTDASINPGNSGGPLLNLRGEQVGINTAAAVDQEQGVAAQGIGFAISINQTQAFINTYTRGGGNNTNGGQQPVASGRPFMGVLPQTMTAGLAARYQLPQIAGVLLGRVDANSPAAQAGWQAGDILTSMDGSPIRNLDDLSAVLQRHKAGDQVTVTLVNRNGQQRQASITFGQNPG